MYCPTLPLAISTQVGVEQEYSTHRGTEITSHPGRIGFHRVFGNPSISPNLSPTGAKKASPRVDIAPHGVQTPTTLADY